MVPLQLQETLYGTPPELALLDGMKAILIGGAGSAADWRTNFSVSKPTLPYLRHDRNRQPYRLEAPEWPTA